MSCTLGGAHENTPLDSVQTDSPVLHLSGGAAKKTRPPVKRLPVNPMFGGSMMLFCQVRLSITTALKRANSKMPLMNRVANTRTYATKLLGDKLPLSLNL